MKQTNCQLSPVSRLGCLAVLWLSCWLPVSGSAGQLERDWIERMSMAMQGLNYIGSFVYIHDSDVEAMKIYHSRIGTTEYERLISLNGEAREIIRDEDSVTCIWPGSKSVIVSKSAPRTPFPTFEPGQLEELSQHYVFEKRPERDRVAGRYTRVIDIKPLDDYRYGYRFWVDEQTDLLLRSVMSDERGNVVEQVLFTDISYPDHVSLDMFRSSLQGERHRWELESADDPMPDLDDNLPEVEAVVLPAGFEPVSDVMVPVVGSNLPARRTMYSDGLASLSVYLSGMDADSENWALMGGSSMGGVHAYGVKIGDRHVTVVGEVPMATVKMIGESLKLAEAPR